MFSIVILFLWLLNFSDDPRESQSRFFTNLFLLFQFFVFLPLLTASVKFSNDEFYNKIQMCAFNNEFPVQFNNVKGQEVHVDGEFQLWAIWNSNVFLPPSTIFTFCHFKKSVVIFLFCMLNLNLNAVCDFFCLKMKFWNSNFLTKFEIHNQKGELS